MASLNYDSNYDSIQQILDRQYNDLISQQYQTQPQMLDPKSFFRQGNTYGNWTITTTPSSSDESFEVPKKDQARVLAAFSELKKSAVVTEKIEGTKMSEHAERLATLGFNKLHTKVKEVAEKAMKTNMIAASGYLKIPAEKLKNAKDKIEHQNDNSRKLYLLETSIENYVGQNADETYFTLPPTDVLEKLEVAKKSELFDSFSILHVKAVPDPILLGRIKGEKDAFFIAEWGDDIKLADIMAQ